MSIFVFACVPRGKTYSGEENEFGAAEDAGEETIPDQQDSPDAGAADRPVVEDEDSGVIEIPESDAGTEPVNPGALSYARDVLPILEEHCTECHHQGRQPDFTSLPADRSLRALMADRILARAVNMMPPPPREAIGAQDLMIIEAWKSEGLWP